MHAFLINPHGPAGAFKQEPTVLNKSLCHKYLSDGKCEDSETDR